MIYYPNESEMHFYRTMLLHYEQRVLAAKTDKMKWFLRNSFNYYKQIVDTKTLTYNV